MASAGGGGFVFSSPSSSTLTDYDNLQSLTDSNENATQTDWNMMTCVISLAFQINGK